jgi:hypothetical protein
MALILCTQCCALKTEHKITALSLYLLADFNNSHTILSRIVSKFRFSIQNLNLKSADRLASFSKYVIKLWLLFDQFLSVFINLHVILTKLSHKFNMFPKSKLDYRSLNDDNFYCASLNFRDKLRRGG